jgi:hypothetical protein
MPRLVLRLCWLIRGSDGEGLAKPLELGGPGAVEGWTSSAAPSSGEAGVIAADHAGTVLGVLWARDDRHRSPAPRFASSGLTTPRLSHA